MPLLLIFCLLSTSFRYIRWRWLLKRAGAQLPPILQDIIIYFSGFAFTATPGKVGELIRIRYYTSSHIPASRIISAFIFERTFDLISVLALTCFAFSHKDLILFSISFVVIFVLILAVLIKHSYILTYIAHRLADRSLTRLSDFFLTFQTSLNECKIWANGKDIIVSFVLGVLAWAVQSYAFLLLIYYLGVDIAFLQGLSIFPIAMLVGAASMLPGGLGSAEASLMFLLNYHGATTAVAMLATIGIRVSTIWFSILLGIGSIAYLEAKVMKHAPSEYEK